MEKRRNGFRLAVAAAGLALGGAAGACVPALEGTRLESARYVLAFQASPEVGKFFSLELAVCAKAGIRVEDIDY